MATKRRQAIADALSLTVPRVPFVDAEAVREAAGARHMRDLPTSQALWLALIAHIRHQHTDYDSLRDEGYELHEARFFVLVDINEVLDRWGSKRQLISEPEDDEEGEP